MTTHITLQAHAHLPPTSLHSTLLLKQQAAQARLLLATNRQAGYISSTVRNVYACTHELKLSAQHPRDFSSDLRSTHETTKMQHIDHC
jgi:hypothetical protein